MHVSRGRLTSASASSSRWSSTSSNASTQANRCRFGALRGGCRTGGSRSDHQRWDRTRVNTAAAALACAGKFHPHQVGAAELTAARKQAASRGILLCMTPSEAPKALQASEHSELLSRTSAHQISVTDSAIAPFASMLN